MQNLSGSLPVCMRARQVFCVKGGKILNLFWNNGWSGYLVPHKNCMTFIADDFNSGRSLVLTVAYQPSFNDLNNPKCETIITFRNNFISNNTD